MIENLRCPNCTQKFHLELVRYDRQLYDCDCGSVLKAEVKLIPMSVKEFLEEQEKLENESKLQNELS